MVVGDKVRVIDRRNGHKFPIGDIVYVLQFDEADGIIYAESAISFQKWWLTPTEYEPLNQEQ